MQVSIEGAALCSLLGTKEGRLLGNIDGDKDGKIDVDGAILGVNVHWYVEVRFVVPPSISSMSITISHESSTI